MASKSTATLEQEILESIETEPTENDEQMTTTKGQSVREKALEEAIAQIERNFGRGAVMRMSENDSFRNVEAISTGSLSLDIALGIGGLPRGRIIEIYGAESAGKSTLAMSTVAQGPKSRRRMRLRRRRTRYGPRLRKSHRVDIDSLLISQPDSAEQALEIVEHLVRSSALDMVVLDSVAALVPASEIRGEMGEFQVGRTSPTHVSGAPKTHRHHQQNQNRMYLHQPAPRKSRRHLRKS